MKNFLAFLLLATGLARSLSAQNVASITSPTSEVLYFSDTLHTLEKMREFGVFLGFARCNGDLANDQSLALKNNFAPAGGLFYRRHVAPFLAFRGSIWASQLSDNDDYYDSPDWRSTRHYSFKTFVSEATLRAEWDILGNRRFRTGIDTAIYTLDKHTQYGLMNGYRRGFYPFIFAGGGIMASDAKAVLRYDSPYNERQLPVINQDLDQGKGLKINPSVAFGAGVHADLSPRWIFGLEAGLHIPFSDFIDGVSASGNPNKNDRIWLVNLSVSYRLSNHDRDRDGVPNKNDRCPDFAGFPHTNGCPDIDHDDVADREDDCPTKAGIRALAGCPIKDADEDGVPDIDDQCPDVPGLLAFKGCPDTDGDGIEDRADSCKTVAGVLLFNGCPDTDGDGIEDKLDACPTEPGPAEYYYGCPVRDTDEDGVEDKLDACLLAKGLPEFKGCPDSDNDGVEDKLDPCPHTPGPKENRGCPVIEKKDLQKLELAVKAVKFETGKAVLKKESNKILSDIADILNRYPYYHLRIEGHTDSQGKDESNLVLSQKRAQACADFLSGKNIAQSRLLVKGFGETQPIADNKTAAGRTKNRRVEFELSLPNNQ